MLAVVGKRVGYRVGARVDLTGALVAVVGCLVGRLVIGESVPRLQSGVVMLIVYLHDPVPAAHSAGHHGFFEASPRRARAHTHTHPASPSPLPSVLSFPSGLSLPSHRVSSRICMHGHMDAHQLLAVGSLPGSCTTMLTSVADVSLKTHNRVCTHTAMLQIAREFAVMDSWAIKEAID